MTPSTPTVTLHIPTSQLAVVLGRLSALLLQAHYAFLQTFHSPEHTEVAVFDPHQRPLVRCTLRAAETAAAGTLSLDPQSAALGPELQSLLSELAQLGTASPENRP